VSEGAVTRPGSSLTRGKTRYQLYRRFGRTPETVWIGTIKLAPSGIQSADRSDCSLSLYGLYNRPTITDITLINIMLFGSGLFVRRSNSHTIFEMITYFRSLNITIDFYIKFHFDSSTKVFKKFLKINLLSSLHFPSLPTTIYPIHLTQSAVNTQFPLSLPNLQFIQSP